MRAEHKTPDNFPVVDGMVCIASQPLTALAERIGTPFFAYDSNLIAARMQALRAILPTSLGVHYALKANPLPALVSFMATQADGMDVASVSEMRRCFPAVRAALTSPSSTHRLSDDSLTPIAAASCRGDRSVRP